MAQEQVEAVIRHAEALRTTDPETKGASAEAPAGTSSIDRD
jgi:hypothetical protein